ncbi:MAG: glucosamine-6-phosphate deaminase [Lachnospiraceae bacterium]|nr:glucosamine-6-phosphate deaminase [Lachnospiraceae bacterium]
MKIYREKDYEAISLRAANILTAQLVLKQNSVLGLATGSSPIGTYKKLVENYKAGEISFRDVRTVNLDEYKGLKDSDPNSYHYFMQENLFSHIDIDPENVHLLSGVAEDSDLECEKYERMIRAIGGIDMQLLGIGRNGHIGFNEPDSSFTVNTHVVDLTESTIEANSRLFDDISQVPRQALSMGIGTIMHAKRILLIANGESKADAIAKVVAGPVTPEVPGSILQLHPDVTIVADDKALSKL